MRSSLRAAVVAVLCFSLVVVLAAPSGAQPPPTDGRFDHAFATPALGMNAVPGRNQVLVADAGQGIVRVGRTWSRLITPMPGVVDVLPVTGNRMFAVTGGPPPEEEGGETELQGPPPVPPYTLTLVKARGGSVRAIANTNEAEGIHNPDGGEVFSNPQDIAKLGRHVYIADAGANAVWKVHVRRGTIQPLAHFPPVLTTTMWLKDAVGCGTGAQLPPEVAELCGLPPEMPAESVPTSIAVGPDGYLYVSELIGFPGAPGLARIWKVDPSARNADCATSDLCEIVLEGFTSIIDINFTSDGDLVVVELDRATFIAAENGMGIGGAVSVCVLVTKVCTDVVDGVMLPTAVAVARGDRLFITVWALVPGSADVRIIRR